jgi:hypothetical protein
MFMDEINQLRRMGFRAVSPTCIDVASAPLPTQKADPLPCCHFVASSQILLQALNLATIIAGGLMGWKALCLATNSESPIVVVLSLVPEPERHLCISVYG